MKPILKHSASTIPAVAVSLVPKFVCGACWPALGVAFAALGIGPIVSVPYLTPLTLVVLALAAANLWRGSSRDRARASFWVGLLAIGGVVAGKFWLESTTALDLGLGLLVLASVWQIVPFAKARTTCGSLGGCEVATTKG